MTTTYYISGLGSDNNNGLTPQTPFRNIQTAANLTQPGDIVYVMNGTYTASNPNSDIVRITRSGTADAWITYQAYPGANPKLVSNNWHAFAILGASHIIIDGFELQGNNDNITLPQAIAEQNNLGNPLTSGNGIGIRPSDDATPTYPHHIVIRNNEVYKFGGGGIYTYHADYVTIENNLVYNNAWYAPYGNSGISNYQNWNSDSSSGYRMIIRGNVTYNNQNLIPWFQVGRVTDGNGIIVDDTRNTQNNSTLGVYQGRTLVENNLSYNNGGRGINVYSSNFVDIVNNTTYQNSQHPAIDGGEITVGTANDVRVLNNIMSATSGKPANKVSNSSNILFDYNLLFNSVLYTQTGANDLIGVDPLFLDPSIGNFALRSNSPALNRGINGLTSRDIVGTLRPIGSGTDIGAFEGVGVIRGSKNRDRLTGTRLIDWIDGGNDNDRIVGDRGNDRLLGGQGNDFIVGQTGDDVLIGGLGSDRLTGGAGKDIFGLRRREGLDVITDFQIGQDYLGLPKSTSFRGLRLVQSGRNTTVQLGGEPLALLIGVRANQLLRSSFAFSNTFYQPVDFVG
ncbi:MAG: right-handed parallel beta-helix repeat-containing protein [Oculatellaceae cyanobacterium bins.114]|nr:right-handed parallel beta-helix repeat-containing protein [Oculatellaceae cyanobacterium bins.114]